MSRAGAQLSVLPALRPTVAELFSAHIEAAGDTLKPATVREIARLYRSKILPAFAGVALAELEAYDVERWYRELARRAPVEANRAASTLRAGWSHAERWGWTPASGRSPVAGLARLMRREAPRERVLSAAELEALAGALAASEPDHSPHVLAIRLLLLTGARPSEIVGLEWRRVDWPGRRILLEEHKTDRKIGARSIALSDAALSLLAGALFPSRSPRVFAGVSLRRFWSRIRLEAGVPDAQLRDFRRTVASRMRDAGVDLRDIAQMLGHSSVRVTSNVYAKLGADRRHELANLAGKLIGGTND